MDALHTLETWAAPLVAQLQPHQVRQLTRELARELRRSQAQRIASQTAPDGTPYATRKPLTSKRLRALNGKIRSTMFNKLRTARHLRADSTDTEASVGFIGRTARIAQVHQDGLVDQVQPQGPSYRYPARQLLGLTQPERDRITDTILRHVSP